MGHEIDCAGAVVGLSGEKSGDVVVLVSVKGSLSVTSGVGGITGEFCADRMATRSESFSMTEWGFRQERLGDTRFGVDLVAVLSGGSTKVTACSFKATVFSGLLGALFDPVETGFFGNSVVLLDSGELGSDRVLDSFDGPATRAFTSGVAGKARNKGSGAVVVPTVNEISVSHSETDLGTTSSRPCKFPTTVASFKVKTLSKVSAIFSTGW